MLSGYYTAGEAFPDRVCLDKVLTQESFLEQSFSQLAGKKVKLYVPLSGESKTLLETAKKNAAEKLARVLSFNDK